MSYNISGHKGEMRKCILLAEGIMLFSIVDLHNYVWACLNFEKEKFLKIFKILKHHT